MKLVIQTQIRENYGAHDWDGVGECPQNWKCKGGTTYVVPNITVQQAAKISEKGAPNLKTLVESRTTGYEEYIIDCRVTPDDTEVCEKWETPYELFYEQGRWVAKRITSNDGDYGYMHSAIAAKIEQYDMLPGGDRTNYALYYTFKDGRTLDYSATCSALAEHNAA